MNSLSVEVVMDFMGISADTVWRMLQDGHAGLLSGIAECSLSGTECTLGNVDALIKNGKNPHFGITVSGMEFHYSHVRNFDHSLLWIRHAVQDVDDAWSWVSPFASSTAFRQAWVYDDKYNYWQNAQDPLEYTAEGRSCAGLPMKSNGLPPPLGQMVIDTSVNPGRRVIRRGYVEAVASVMWLGSKFWTLTGANRELVLADSLVCSQTISDQVVRLQVGAAPFSTSEGVSGTVQNKLRVLLYPKVK